MARRPAEAPPRTPPPAPERRGRLRSGLRRHGLVRRPEAIHALMRSHELRFVDGNGIEVYDTGETGLAAMLAAIRAARERVLLETYILRADATGQEFLDALSERARAGVDVRLLYDGIGSRALHDAAVEPLRRAGGLVVAFNPPGRIYPSFAPRRRDHRKLLLVDGRIAFTGGLNIGDEYAHGLGAGDLLWRDAHVRIEGPVVRDLAAVFLESWFRADGPGLSWHDVLGPAPPVAGSVRCAVLADGPTYRRRRMRDLLVSGLASASDSVLLESPYFAPGRRVLEALERAGQQGVGVRLLLAARTDHPVMRRGARELIDRLVRRDVEVREYEGAMMHAKVAVFDRDWAIVGTSNLDRQSLEHSYEVNLILEGGGIPERLRERFERDFTTSRPVTAATLDARRPWTRLVDALASLLLRLI